MELGRVDNQLDLSHTTGTSMKWTLNAFENATWHQNKIDKYVELEWIDHKTKS